MANRISVAGIFAQLASTRNNGVVLIQLGVGVGVKITPRRSCCGAAQVAVAVALAMICSLLKQLKFGIRHCAVTSQAHDKYQ